MLKLRVLRAMWWQKGKRAARKMCKEKNSWHPRGSFVEKINGNFVLCIIKHGFVFITTVFMKLYSNLSNNLTIYWLPYSQVGSLPGWLLLAGACISESPFLSSFFKGKAEQRNCRRDDKCQLQHRINFQQIILKEEKKHDAPQLKWQTLIDNNKMQPKE